MARGSFFFFFFNLDGKDAGEDVKSEHHGKTMHRDRQKHRAGPEFYPPPDPRPKKPDFSGTGTAGSNKTGEKIYIKPNASLLSFPSLRSRVTVTALL